MPQWLNFFDSLFIIVLLISGIFAFVRGFTREMFAIGAWFLSAFLVKLIYPFLEPLVAEGLGKSSIWSSTISYFIAFIGCLIIISYIANHISNRIKTTNFKYIDRSLGFVFGLLRGVLIMAAFYLLILWFIPENKQRPEWLSKESKLTPVLNYGINIAVSFFPDGPEFSRIKELANGTRQEGYEIKKDKSSIVKINNVNANSSQTNQIGYTKEEMKALDDHINKLQQLDKIETDILN